MRTYTAVNKLGAVTHSLFYTLPAPSPFPRGTQREKELIKVVDLQLSDSKVTGSNLESIWLTSCLR